MTCRSGEAGVKRAWLHFSSPVWACAWLAFLGLGALANPVVAPASERPPWSRGEATSERDVAGWLARLHEAASRSTYTGTLVVSAGPDISASRIWHACDGSQQVERVERLTGSPRITWRRNDEVVTLVPESRVATWERRDGLRLFPAFPEQPGRQIAELYSARVVGRERVAGLDADVVEFQPRDRLRFGYRIWSARGSGLALKLQTRDATGEVLEQASFTDLQPNAALSAERLARQMAVPAGYQTVRPNPARTTAQAQGWRLREAVAGFQPSGCQVPSSSGGAESAPLQCVLTDGLASVSLFIEAYDPARHVREAQAASGATHSVSRRLHDRWVTAVGEVPTDTLRRLSQALEPTR